MKKTSYKITKMDCPSEEQLIRMKLSGNSDIRHLDFDIPNRTLAVYHQGDAALITEAIGTLELGSSFQESVSDILLPAKANESSQRRLLWQVLLINFTLFCVEMATGFI